MCVPLRKEPQTCKYPRVTRTTYVNIYGKSFFLLVWHFVQEQGRRKCYSTLPVAAKHSLLFCCRNQ